MAASAKDITVKFEAAGLVRREANLIYFAGFDVGTDFKAGAVEAVQTVKAGQFKCCRNAFFQSDFFG